MKPETISEELTPAFIEHLRKKEGIEIAFEDFQLVELDHNQDTNKTKVVITYTETGKVWYENTKREYPFSD